MGKTSGVVFAAAVCMFLTACHMYQKESVTVAMYAVNDNGIGQNIGQIKIKDSERGLILKVNVKGVGTSVHGFHVHANPSCGNIGTDGKRGAGLAAGGHYDPGHTGKHLGPDAAGHKGDLPYLKADSKGNIKMKVVAPKLAISEIKNRTFMIHAGGDNYADYPEALGGGGARIACGVIK